jgi:hypothetical protein
MTLMTRTLPAPQTKRRIRGPNAPVENGDRRKQAKGRRRRKKNILDRDCSNSREALEVQRKG